MSVQCCDLKPFCTYLGPCSAQFLVAIIIKDFKKSHQLACTISLVSQIFRELSLVVCLLMFKPRPLTCQNKQILSFQGEEKREI